MSTQVSVSREEKQTLDNIIAAQAATAPLALGAKGYMGGLISRTNWPPRWRASRTGGLTGIPDYDAQHLVSYAVSQGSNPADERKTVLVGLLEALINDVGLEDRRWLVALISAHNLYNDSALLDSLVIRYQVPQAPGALRAGDVDFGPEILWQGPTNQVELHGWLRSPPDFQDVGFLKRAIERAASVCRVEIPRQNPQGTGFLIAPTLLLTNCHVLQNDESEDIEDNARKTVLRFGHITAADGKEADGQEFKLDANEPILSSSPQRQLDYVLLQVEAGVAQAEGISPAPYTAGVPHKGMGLNILQHPAGQTLKLALTGDGVDAVLEDSGKVQYSTRALRGSSGAPCFNDDWMVIALHRSQRCKAFGTIREGIIMRSILEEIAGYLS